MQAPPLPRFKHGSNVPFTSRTYGGNSFDLRKKLDYLVKTEARRALDGGQALSEVSPSGGRCQMATDAPNAARKGARRKKSDSPENETRIQSINRRIILDAALEVFSAFGFRGATLDQIAEKAGMSKPNLLYYFPRKQHIYVNVLEDTLVEWLQPFEQINPEGDPLEELKKYIVRKLEMSESRPEASRLFANEIMHGAPAIGTFLKTHLRQLVDGKAGVINHWIAEKRIAPVDPYHLIFTIWATTQHYADFNVQVRAIMGEKADSPSFRDETAKAIVGIILNGIRPR